MEKAIDISTENCATSRTLFSHFTTKFNNLSKLTAQLLLESTTFTTPTALFASQFNLNEFFNLKRKKLFNFIR